MPGSTEIESSLLAGLTDLDLPLGIQHLHARIGLVDLDDQRAVFALHLDHDGGQNHQAQNRPATGDQHVLLIVPADSSQDELPIILAGLGRSRWFDGLGRDRLGR